MSFQSIADAMVMVDCGNSSGSGFHLIDQNTVVTNANVVDPAVSGSEPIYLQTESKKKIEAELIDHSPADEYDYAILETMDQFGEQRNILDPSTKQAQRGQKIRFAGFPHGIEDLLVHEAPVSGPWNNRGFYIDGSVNGGNSGRPIIDPETGDVIGIVTKRRFFGELDMKKVTLVPHTVSRCSQCHRTHHTQLCTLGDLHLSGMKGDKKRSFTGGLYIGRAAILPLCGHLAGSSPNRMSLLFFDGRYSPSDFFYPTILHLWRTCKAELISKYDYT